jgi:hypothetical protein
VLQPGARGIGKIQEPGTYRSSGGCAAAEASASQASADARAMNVILFYLLLTAFTAPGYALARRWHAPDDNRWFLVAAGFVYSLAIFAAVAWPCLWFTASSATYLALLGALWGSYGLVALVIWLRTARGNDFYLWPRQSLIQGRAVDAGPPISQSVAGDQHCEPGWAQPQPRGLACPSYLTSIAVRGLALVVLGECIVSGLLSEDLAGTLNPLRALPRAELLLSAITFAVAAALAPAIYRLQKERSKCDSVNAPAPPLWTCIAVIAVVALVAGVTCAARPDWDDTWYLSAVQRYSEEGDLNHEGFSLPGEDFVPPHQRLLAWELFGATLCHFSGVHPMVSHHTLLPPVLLLLALCVHWRFFSTHLLSRRLAPLAMLGLIGYWLFAVSSYDSPGSFALTRAWQGKATLWVLGLPLIVNVLWSYLKKPSPGAWLACLLASVGALAMSSSAVFLVAALIPLFCVAMALFGGLSLSWRTFLASCALAAPQTAYGLLVRAGMSNYGALAEKPEGAGWLQSIYFCGIQYGSAELLWALLLPLSAALLVSRPARAYLVGLPCLLAATVLNPLAYEWVAGHLTSYHTHNRLLWLLPIGTGLGAAVALASDAIMAPFRSKCSTCRLLLALAMVAGLAYLPGRCAWSESNEGPYPGLCFAWGENAYKVPNDLMPIVQRVSQDACLEDGRLLLPEHLTQFFAPYSSQIRFVSSRPTHTVEALAAQGRGEEGFERVDLVLRLLGGKGTESLVGELSHSTATSATIPELLLKYKVKGIVTDQRSPSFEARLRRYGYVLAIRSGKYAFWKVAA